MEKSIHSEEYEVFVRLLRDARKMRRFTQTDLAEKLDRPQSFVSKIETGERRLDLVEFLFVAKALRLDASKFVRKLSRTLAE